MKVQEFLANLQEYYARRYFEAQVRFSVEYLKKSFTEREMDTALEMTIKRFEPTSTRNLPDIAFWQSIKGEVEDAVCPEPMRLRLEAPERLTEEERMRSMEILNSWKMKMPGIESVLKRAGINENA